MYGILASNRLTELMYGRRLPSRALRATALALLLAMIAVACGGDLDTSTPRAEPAAEEGGTPNRIFGEPIPETPEQFNGLTDTSQAIVELQDVVFDTFDGGSITLDEANDGDVVRLLDAIPPIDNPAYIDPATDPWLEDEDLILGYVAEDGQAYAYPHKILNFHEIVNDNLAGVPVLISYCPLCNSGVVFDRRITDLRQDGELTFSNTSALFDNDMVMVDRQTSSYWWQVPGRSIVGTLSGAELTVLPSTTTTWGRWRFDNPETVIITRDLGFRRDYTRDPFAGYAERLNSGGSTPFPVDEAALADDRLPPASQVIAIEANGEAVVVPIELLSGEFEVEVGGDQFLVVPDFTGGAEAFAIDGEGNRSPAPSRSTFWFAYVAAFPEATVAAP